MSKISKSDLINLVKEYSPREGKAIELARELNAKNNTGYSDKYVADAISQDRGTATPRCALLSIETDRRNMKMHELIDKYEEKHPNASACALGKMIVEMEKLDNSPKHVTNVILKRRREDGAIRAKADTNGREERYHVRDGKYMWKYHRGEMIIPVQLADQMFYEYSKHGLDLSQSQMRQKHKLKIWEWNTIKLTLFLYKDSNIISPYTEDNTPPDQLQSVIDGAIAEKMNDKQRLIEESYNKQTILLYKKAVEEKNVKTFALQSMIDELDEITRGWHSEPAKVKRTDDFKTERRWISVAIADLHVGALSSNEQLTPDFSSARLRQLLDKTANEINAQQATDVTLMILGDLIESFTGLNHKNTWQSVEQGLTGAKLIKETISILEEFFSKINNLRQVLAVSGNHDRITASNKEDTRGQVAEIIFYILDRIYAGNLEIRYSDLVIAAPVDGIQYVITHSDKHAIKDGKQAVLDYGDNKLFNVILSGHLHSRRTVEDHKSFRWISTPSIFSGNRYSEENAWHARPGFTIIRNDGTGLPIITDVTIA